MSDFQLVLLAIGAGIVVVVLAYNKWQERRLRQHGDAAFGSRHDDVLLGAGSAPERIIERIEPVLGGPPVQAGGNFAEAGAVLPAPAEAIAETTTEQEPAPAVDDGLPLDGRLDWVMVLHPAAGNRLEPAPMLKSDWAGAGKRVALFGEDDGKWGPLQAGTGYDRALVALQLADRRGPVSLDEAAAMAALVGDLAAANGWRVEADDAGSIARRAADLDRFCAELDVRILFEVIATGDKPFPGTKIRGLAEANGLVLAGGGTFVRSDEAGGQLFTLKNRGATPFSPEHLREFSTRALTLTLDVPRAPRGAYREMRGFAMLLCEALQGSIVDEQGRKLDAAAMDRVALQLAAIESRLAQLGVVPGDAAALRLFS